MTRSTTATSTPTPPRWVLESAEGWLRDFHVDGLRLDAIHAIYDTVAVPIMASSPTASTPRAKARSSSPSRASTIRRSSARASWRFAHDAQWADDFHHALRVPLTGDRGGYYAAFGAVADLAEAFARPFYHAGRYSTFRKRRFGAPARRSPAAPVRRFDQNHDQVGNRAFGDRLPAEAVRSRPSSRCCLRSRPCFMGEEYGEPAPFSSSGTTSTRRSATATTGAGAPSSCLRLIFSPL